MPGRIHSPVGLYGHSSGAHCCSEIPMQFSLGSRDTQLPCVATGRYCRSLGGGEAMYWQGEAYRARLPSSLLMVEELASGRHFQTPSGRIAKTLSYDPSDHQDDDYRLEGDLTTEPSIAWKTSPSLFAGSGLTPKLLTLVKLHFEEHRMVQWLTVHPYRGLQIIHDFTIMLRSWDKPLNYPLLMVQVSIMTALFLLLIKLEALLRNKPREGHRGWTGQSAVQENC
ncbi:hypothetical protein SKAU_G00094010 [Synaphobranchus kaupii]|uniref:Uncharacterized protein n=1 Tax=Synaphobranchus kaupii TaxID=118154 RepID=A0A9Q1FY31_SYNKA|nr:hypothetical protein SKAU_G00094010 [Synaphobranchus kaupii]